MSILLSIIYVLLLPLILPLIICSIFLLFYIPISTITNRKNTNIISNSIDTLFKIQNFHNIRKDNSFPGLSLIYADSSGENYLFAQKTSMIPFSIMDIHTLYEQAQKSHIHNIIVLQLTASLPNNILNKLKEYNIQIWDQNKINSLIYSPNTSSILSTSDTSDDTCKIDKNQFNPIQEPHSFLKSIFKKPDRL